MHSIADAKTVTDLSREIQTQLPGLSKQYPGVPTKSGRKEYTYAVYEFWKRYAQEKLGSPSAWKIYREYLTDFMIFEEGYGPRIACESEWGPRYGEPEWILTNCAE
jgi:hypothetical protein